MAVSVQYYWCEYRTGSECYNKHYKQSETFFNCINESAMQPKVKVYRKTMTTLWKIFIEYYRTWGLKCKYQISI